MSSGENSADRFPLGLEHRVAVVTGASRGIGFAISRSLVARGVKVLMVARKDDSLAAAVTQLQATGGSVASLTGDVSDPALPEKVRSKAIDLWGSVDILVNNAGGPPMGTFLEHGPNAWSEAIETNLLSAVRFCRAVVPGMIERNWGRIVSITSTVAKEPSPSMVLSATVRAGVSAFTKAIATDLAPHNITVNVLCPGGVLTERLESLLQVRAQREGRSYEDVLRESQTSIPIGRFADPEEIANVALFLISDLGGYITGVSLSVDGGLTKGYS